MIPEQVTYLASTGEFETLEFKDTTGTRCWVAMTADCAP